MMQREIRDRWTAALRSGEYEQGQGQLRTDDGKFCCLGVLCDVTGFDLNEHIPGRDRPWARSGGTMAGPPVLLDLDHPLREELARMNDTGHSFTEIADYIDEHIETE